MGVGDGSDGMGYYHTLNKKPPIWQWSLVATAYIYNYDDTLMRIIIASDIERKKKIKNSVIPGAASIGGGVPLALLCAFAWGASCFGATPAEEADFEAFAATFLPSAPGAAGLGSALMMPTTTTTRAQQGARKEEQWCWNSPTQQAIKKKKKKKKKKIKRLVKNFGRKKIRILFTRHLTPTPTQHTTAPVADGGKLRAPPANRTFTYERKV